MPIDRAAQTAHLPAGMNPVLYSIIVLPNKWSQLSVIHVCFAGGDPMIRGRILKIAQIWFDLINLKLDSGGPTGRDCVDHDRSEVRIGFDEPGYWSYIGNDSISSQLINSNLTSMNFQGFDKSPPAEPRFTGVILHEWGHALALHHEHQSPAAGCDAEYNWPKLYDYYKKNYGWDQKMVDDNVRQLAADHSAYDWSVADPLSIMIYGSDPAFLYRGVQSPCYFHDNDSLSQLDVAGIERAYPREQAAFALQVQATTLPLALKAGITGDLRKAIETQNGLAQQQLMAAPQ